jgi:uncharacterized protein (TIGR02118 family)
MFRFIALYGKPDDADGFEEHYRRTHISIMERWPGVQSTHVSRVVGTPRGAEAPYHLVTDVAFASRDDFMQAMATDAGKESAQDARAMAERFGVELTMLLCEDF